jgi:thymidylate synthase
MALAPCHTLFQCYVEEIEGEKHLSVKMFQRSADMFLGVPFNIASYALLTHMLAQVTNMKVKDLIISFGDTHIYGNHVEQVKELLSRDLSAYKLPTLELNPDVKCIDDFTMDDIKVVGYQSHAAIKADVSV